ncbi:hypothetical protein MTP06_51890 [Streptomyces sp. PLM4]|nr:hypothetical protein MTP06_51890 [Streptomyces sp. PLM4]
MSLSADGWISASAFLMSARAIGTAAVECGSETRHDVVAGASDTGVIRSAGYGSQAVALRVVRRPGWCCAVFNHGLAPAYEDAAGPWKVSRPGGARATGVRRRAHGHSHRDFCGFRGSRPGPVGAPRV